MELVRGIPITKFCEENGMELRERVELFVKVCHAIQHAHQKGIIHRDIKPTNVLVTLHDGVPVPKVIDFGIAKATQGELTEKTIHTQFQQFIGTPAYVSPEQAEMSGLDVDTRTDIYSLGVLMYELLTGSTPFDGRELMASGIDAMRRTIREKEPERPSTRLKMTGQGKAGGKGLPPGMTLTSDLDWIVMKCLEKDRARRYETANGLASDIRRYLADEPVVARPPSTGYRIQKAWKRNKLAYSSAGAVLAAIVVGVVATSWQAIQATRARDSEFLLRQKAQQLQEQEAASRLRAEAGERDALRSLYASEMQLAFRSWQDGLVRRSREILLKYRPIAGQSDVRGFEWRLLWTLTQQRTPVSLPGSPGAPITLTRDGKVLAMGGEGGSLQLFDTATWQPMASLKGHALDQNVGCVAFSLDGTKLASGTGKLFNPNEPAEVFVWELSTGKVLRKLTGHSFRFTSLAFSHDGRHLAASGTDGSLMVWDLSTGEGRVLHQDPLDFFWSVAASPVSPLLVSSHKKTGLRIWDLTRGEVIHRISAGPDTFCGVTFDQEGTRVAVATAEGLVQIFDVATWKLLTTLPHSSHGRISVGFSQDGGLLASGGGNDITVWDLKKFEPVRRFLGCDEVGYVGFPAGGGKVVANVFFDPPQLWTMGEPLIETVAETHADGIRAMALSLDGRLLATGSGDFDQPYRQAEIKIWELPSRRLLRTLPAHEADILTLGFTPDNRRLISGGADQTVKIWEVASGKRLHTLTPATRVIGGLSVSPDGGLLACALGIDSKVRTQFALENKPSAAERGSVQLYDIRGAEPLPRELIGVPELANCVTFSPDGKQLAFAGVSGTVRIWDIQSKAVERSFQHEREIDSLAFSPDGTRLAAGTHDFMVLLWGLKSASPKPKLLPGHISVVTLLAFSPDGRTLASGAADCSVRLWDASGGQLFGTLPLHKDQVWGLAFTPDGNTLISGSRDRTLKFWHAMGMDRIEAGIQTSGSTNFKMPVDQASNMQGRP